MIKKSIFLFTTVLVFGMNDSAQAQFYRQPGMGGFNQGGGQGGFNGGGQGGFNRGGQDGFNRGGQGNSGGFNNTLPIRRPTYNYNPLQQHFRRVNLR